MNFQFGSQKEFRGSAERCLHSMRGAVSNRAFISSKVMRNNSTDLPQCPSTAWGLLADIEPPELEVRIAIMRKKAAVESVSLPDDVAMYIASSTLSRATAWGGGGHKDRVVLL